MFSDRIENLSRGTIPLGQTMEGFFAGESVPVNQKLSDMLLQLHISERIGRGVPKITEVYGKGTYEFRENSIVVSIPFTRVSTEDEDPRWIQDRTQDGTQEDSKGSSEYTGLNREMVDAFVEEIVVYAKDRVEIKWKFKEEFGEVEMSKKIECSVENMEMGWYN